MILFTRRCAATYNRTSRTKHQEVLSRIDPCLQLVADQENFLLGEGERLCRVQYIIKLFLKFPTEPEPEGGSTARHSA
jgi:hypothetical protein